MECSIYSKDLYITPILEIWGKAMIRKGLAVIVILLFIGMSVVPASGTIIKESYGQISSGNNTFALFAINRAI